MAPFAPWALGLGKGLLEGMLSRVYFFIQELSCQLCPVADLDLRGAKQWPQSLRHSPLNHRHDLSHLSPEVPSQLW